MALELVDDLKDGSLRVLDLWRIALKTWRGCRKNRVQRRDEAQQMHLTDGLENDNVTHRRSARRTAPNDLALQWEPARLDAKRRPARRRRVAAVAQRHETYLPTRRHSRESGNPCSGARTSNDLHGTREATIALRADERASQRRESGPPISSLSKNRSTSIRRRPSAGIFYPRSIDIVRSVSGADIELDMRSTQG